MCIIGLSLNETERFPFVLWANRDEFYRRPSKEMHYRLQEPKYIGGKDLEKGGSWLGINPFTGDIAAVTNIRKGSSDKKDALSRGILIDRYMCGGIDTFSLEDRNQFNGFNLIYGNIQKGLFYTSSKLQSSLPIQNGIHAISNGDFNEPWPKTERMKKRMQQIDPEWSVFEMIQEGHKALGDTTEANERDLPDTGIDISLEKKLSPIRISLDEYGSVCSTIIFLDDEGVLHCYEYRYTDGKQMYYASPFR